MIKITKDLFVWLIVTETAEQVFNGGAFSLYELQPDDAESLINTLEELNTCLDNGSDIGIEGGFLFDYEVASEQGKDFKMRLLPDKANEIDKLRIAPIHLMPLLSGNEKVDDSIAYYATPEEMLLSDDILFDIIYPNK